MITTVKAINTSATPQFEPEPRIILTLFLNVLKF